MPELIQLGSTPSRSATIDSSSTPLPVDGSPIGNPRSPQTPRSIESWIGDPSSSYYTAAWGSPYDYFPGSVSTRSAASESISNDHPADSSPIPDFGLSSLIPARLTDRSSGGRAHFTSRTIPVVVRGHEKEQERTLRSHDERWVELPRRKQGTEKPRWWSDESTHNSSDSDFASQRKAWSAADQRRQSRSGRGHKSRTSNQTIDQQSFWDQVRDKNKSMSALFASRWADTPPNDESETIRKDLGFGMFNSRWADTPPLAEAVDEQAASDKVLISDASSAPAAASRLLAPASLATSGYLARAADDSRLASTIEGRVRAGSKAMQAAESTTGLDEEAAVIESSMPVEADRSAMHHRPSKSRAETARMRRKVFWRGKPCIISIPDFDRDTPEWTKPMSSADFQAKLELFREAGHDVDGFDLSPERFSELNDRAHAKPIYPDDTEARAMSPAENTRIRLPDLKKWSAYMDWLTEQKLAALGVSPVVSDSNALAPSRDMSRQSSGHYPVLPFSPPLLANAGAGQERPATFGGHTHRMSVASPISQPTSPFGHMHRHSTYTTPLAFQQLQQQVQQPGPLALRAFSPPMPPHLATSPFNGLSASPLQNHSILPPFVSPVSSAPFVGPRHDSNDLSGPSSPYVEAVRQTPQDPSRLLAINHLNRENALSPTSQQIPGPAAFSSTNTTIQPTPTLPEVPEEDGEEDGEARVDRVPWSAAMRSPSAEPERPAYVPPHKRAELNADIAIPTPRGHRHNISEHLERDAAEAEKRTEAYEVKSFGVKAGDRGRQSSSLDLQSIAPRHVSTDDEESHSASGLAQASSRTHKKTASRFNVAAPEFTFKPVTTFEHAAGTFSFGAPNTTPLGQGSMSHSRHQSSGSLNVSAPVFKPTGMPTLPKQDFSFSMNGPSFNSGATSTASGQQQEFSSTRGASSIFGKVEIPDFVKPARRSKAIAIMKPAVDSTAESGTDPEDDDGRIVQSDERFKRQRQAADDGDEVPRFAEPTPLSSDIGSSQPAVVEQKFASKPQIANEAVTEQDPAPVLEVADQQSTENEFNEEPHEHADEVSQSRMPATEAQHHHRSSSALLSALARPFHPFARFEAQDLQSQDSERGEDGASDLEEGEIREDDDNSVSPMDESESGDYLSRGEIFGHPVLASDEPEVVDYPGTDDVEPSFDDIDAVMRKLNSIDEGHGFELGADISPMPTPRALSREENLYLPSWSRSDAPSPSPKHEDLQAETNADSSRPPDGFDRGEEHPVRAPPRVRELFNGHGGSTEDWSDVFSPSAEEQIHQRGASFDDRIASLITDVIQKRLQPFEEVLRNVQSTSPRKPPVREFAQRRSSSVVDSDADDEDDSGEKRSRPISRGKDKRAEQVKVAVLEALHEQSLVTRAEPSRDVLELHDILTDMKTSFARAASSSLELDDIRAVVEDTIGKQSQALVSASNISDETREVNNRDLCEMEDRLNEALAQALEEANLRRAVERREAETRKMLRLAEEEMQLLRESNRDDDSRLESAEHERKDFLHRLENAKEAMHVLQEHNEVLEEELAASTATLEEYRMSSHQWREDVDHSTRDREELVESIRNFQHSMEKSQESISMLQQKLDSMTQEVGDYRSLTGELERRLEQSQEAGSGMRTSLEALHSDLITASDQLANEKAAWKAEQDELQKRNTVLADEAAVQVQARAQLEAEIRSLRLEIAEGSKARLLSEERSVAECQSLKTQLAGQLEARIQLDADIQSLRTHVAEQSEARRLLDERSYAERAALESQIASQLQSREQLDAEVLSLRVVAADASDARSLLSDTNTSAPSIAHMVREMLSQLQEQRAESAYVKNELHGATEGQSARFATVQMQFDRQCKDMRAQLEAERAQMLTELKAVKAEADVAKVNHGHELEREKEAAQAALSHADHVKRIALDEVNSKHAVAMQELEATYARSLSHATEDRERSEKFASERLSLSDAKLEHFQDRVLHLEERLEVAKSAAHAAAMSAQSRTAPAVSNSRAVLPEKVSPQALRESILVLQEQLQDRESLIENLRSQVNKEGPAKIKAKDDEIAWLRELLNMRSEDLTELVNTLAQPTFERSAVRDTAIRIRASLQMEQQEKERSNPCDTFVPAQAIASLSNFATPAAAQLSSAFSKWRANMESSALRNAPRGNGRPRSTTPLKPRTAIPKPANGYVYGLMTPPASNIRNTPSPEPTVSLSPPQLSSNASFKSSQKPRSDRPTTPLLRPQSYDEDAEDTKAQMETFDESVEDDLNIADTQPPGFRSLEAELEAVDQN